MNNLNLNYTGVGSREAPEEILHQFVEIGKFLGFHSFTLRSGHAPGSDKAFERGCDIFNGNKEIYLPWYRFENSDSPYFNVSKQAYDMACRYHGYWGGVSDGAKKLLARDCYQILGYDLNSPSAFVVCWTKNGKTVGGTSMVIRIANDFNIPTFNYGMEGTHMKLQKFLMDNYGLKLL